MASEAVSVADNIGFVFFAYFLAFGIWTAASGNDFINSSWKSVIRTRRRGQCHVLLVSVPMVYMSAYIYFQYQIGDYKEMCAALLALAFAILHLIRTVVGLWQLQIFKQWTIASIKSMESLGFKTQIPVQDSSHHNDDDVDIEGRISHSQRKDQSFDSNCESRDSEHNKSGSETVSAGEEDNSSWESLGERERIDRDDVDVSSRAHSQPGHLKSSMQETPQERIERQADEIFVNDTIIDNRMSEVSTTCYLQLLSGAEKNVLKREKSPVKRLFFTIWLVLCSVYRLFKVLILLSSCKFPHVPNSETSPLLLPRHPENVSIHWATALVAQADWLTCFDGDMLPTDPGSSADYAAHRNHFAEQILISAALHSRRTDGRNNISTGSQSSYDTSASFLSFRDWHQYPNLCRGKFSKQEFLRRACTTGCGLPYNAPHPKAVEEKGGVRRFGYEKFESEIRRAREALPADIEARVNKFDVEALEWFTIFASVGIWFPAHEIEKKNDQKELDSTAWENSDNEESEPENDIPVENLRRQLGFSDRCDLTMSRFRFPLLSNIPQKTLWGNRNILQVSCHVDNWLALCAGEQTSYMVKHVPWMDQKCLLNSVPTEEIELQANTTDDAESYNHVLQNNVDLERCKFMCQMAIVKPEDAHFEKSATFLGCSMEMLRSSLAKWVANVGATEESEWKPSIDTYDKIEGEGRNSLLQFTVSDVLAAYLHDVSCVSHLSERYIEMSILWELQNQLYSNLPDIGLAPHSVQAKVLCVISFPALLMDIRHNLRLAGVSRIKERREHCILDLDVKDKGRFDIQDFEYAIRASCGPQDVCVIVSFSKVEESSKIFMSVGICREEETAVGVFDWQLWRDSFYGRLEGIRLWQEKLGVERLPLLPTTQNMWTGIEKTRKPVTGTGSTMSFWKGWIPPRASICFYEIASPGFLMQAVESGSVVIPIPITEVVHDRFKIPLEKWAHVAYKDANALSLKLASIVGQELLKSVSEFADASVDGLLETETRPEHLMRPETDGNGSLALLFLELDAVRMGDVASLETAIMLLLKNKFTTNSITRGVRLLERFYISRQLDPECVGWSARYLSRFFEDENRVTAVLSMFEKLFVKSNYDHFVAARYMRFLLLLSQYAKTNIHESARTTMFKFLTFRSHMQETTKAAFAISDFSRTLSAASEDFAVKFLACSNLMTGRDIRKEENIPGYPINRWRAVKAETIVDFCDFIRDVSMQEKGGDILRRLGLSPRSAIDLHMQAAADGHFPNALTSLGIQFEQGGNGVSRDIHRAAKLYKRAIDEGQDVHGMYMLARLLVHKPTMRDVPRAVRLFNRAINEESATPAMYELGLLLMWGAEGLEPDVPRAMHLFERAIEQDRNVAAMKYLAGCLQSGIGNVKRDVPRAASLYEDVIKEHGDPGAMYELALLLIKGKYGMNRDVPRAVELLTRAAIEGRHLMSMHELGFLFAIGKHGLQKDISRAAEFLEMAVNEGGNADAMVGLGDLLLEGGEGVKKDIPRAADLYQRAICNYGGRLANNRLALLLQRGEGVLGKNIPRVIQLYTQDIDEWENSTSMSLLALLLIKGGEGVEKNIPRAMMLLEKAIEHGNVLAMMSLADLLKKGADGIEKDLSRSRELYCRAVAIDPRVQEFVLLRE